MTCKYNDKCGGCPYRNLQEQEYRNKKFEHFCKQVAQIQQNNIKIASPIFIADGTRRRAELTFAFQKKKLSLGFNAPQSHEIIDIEECPLLTKKINEIIPQLRPFLTDLCQQKIKEKVKNKIKEEYITGGEIWITETTNGIDLLLEINNKISLDHRLIICDFANFNENIIRISISIKKSLPETIIEKARPYIYIADIPVYIPSGTFLQASVEGEKALTSVVSSYIGQTTGNIADLFCGVGTFSYPLAKNINNKITAIDSSEELLSGFKKTINQNMIPNIEIIRKNLFKYPLTADELKKFNVIVFDPPRAGASNQIKQLSYLSEAEKPKKIIAVSCNPNTFINDANSLISFGYTITEITMIDQFTYSPHNELVALFEK
jgi:23S rRNA (uracil1939-C5)-methyltransferase